MLLELISYEATQMKAIPLVQLRVSSLGLPLYVLSTSAYTLLHATQYVLYSILHTLHTILYYTLLHYTELY